MYDILKKYPPQSEEKLSEKRANDIKAAVLSRIKEENVMKKHLSIKTLSIAAAAATMAAVSAMVASAESAPTLPLVRSETAPTAPAEETPKTEGEIVPDNTAASEVNTEKPVSEYHDAITAELEAAQTELNKGVNATYTEMTSDIPTDEQGGKWVYLDCPNGTKAEYFVPDGKVPMSFDNAKAAIDYSLSNSTSSTEEEWVSCFDCCDNFAVILVDA